MTLIATIAAIALVAVGIGYAYTAMTTNTGNTASTEYITLVQDGTGAYQFSNGEKVYWDSDDKKVGEAYEIDYTLSSGSATDIVTGYTTVPLGKPITLKTAPQTDGTAKASVSCQVIASSFTLPTFEGAKAGSSTASIFMVVTTTDSSSANQKSVFKLTAANDFDKGTYNNSTWTWDNADAGNLFTIYRTAASSTEYNDVTVQMYYGLTSNPGKVTYSRASTTAAVVGPSGSVLSGAELKFKVSVPGDNNPATKELNNFELSKVSMTITGTGTDTSKVTFIPGDADEKGITCVSANESTATVTYNSETATITVTGVAAGSTTITVTSTDGGFVKTISVTVS